MLVTLHQRPAGGERSFTVDAPGVTGDVHWGGAGDPVVGIPVDVELGVPEPVDWGAVLPALSPTEAPVVAEGELLLSGVVEHLDDDGAGVLRVAGAIVLVETLGAPPAVAAGTHVTLLVRGATVYPTGI